MSHIHLNSIYIYMYVYHINHLKWWYCNKSLQNRLPEKALLTRNSFCKCMTPNLIHFVHTNTQTANIWQPPAALLPTFAMIGLSFCQGAVFFATSRDQRSVFVDTFQPDISWRSDGRLETQRFSIQKERKTDERSACAVSCVYARWKDVCISLCGYEHIALHFDCLRGFVVAFLCSGTDKNQAFISIPGPLREPLCPRLNQWIRLPSPFRPPSIHKAIMTSIRPSHWDISWYVVLHATKPWRWRDGKATSNKESPISKKGGKMEMLSPSAHCFDACR